MPPEIGQLTNLTVLGLSKNPLESPPPEILAQGIEAIFEFLRHPAEEHNEAKMILVGQGDVGKTCLAKRLIYDEFIGDKSTEGIDILEWCIAAPTAAQKKIKLNVWDFGGQEIYHATHQFFLTKRSVYLLVWNARRALDFEHIYYWLHTIEAFGGDSPIVLVMSKRNERDDDLNMKEFREKFPQIVGLYKIDSEDGKGIPALKDIISETAWHLPHMRTPWVKSWYNVRERLEHDGREWIGYTEFEQICESEGLDNKQADILDKYLHDLGVIIHFRDRLELRNMVILNPEWATKAVYKILDTQSILDRGGILLHSELDKIWNSDIYPPDIFPKLLGLMNKFELAFELPDKKSHLVAELLPKTEPEFGWDETNNLRFYYRYDFLPAGVITRFIVLMHDDLEDKPDGTHLCCREGAVLQRGDTRALVKVKPLEKLIEIKINGSRKRELLAIIRNQFDHINRSIKKVEVAQEIPCNCSSNCPYKFNYEKLLMAEERGKKTVDCQESWKEVPLSALLDGFVKKEERMKEITTRDIYIIGQGGAIGPGAYAHDMTFNQLWNEIKDEIDLSALTKELKELRSKLKEEATEPEHDKSIGAIAAAESSAKESNGPKALEYLSKAGKWTLDKATKISVPVATAALKAALGL
ncbi:GTPase SAR1 family protein [Methanophagales archaeon]|nr:GTPase SAR1 family protein [Methanophagales archaeon]